MLKDDKKDVERLKEGYKLLNDNDEILSDALKNKLTYFKFNEAGHSEEIQKYISLVEKRILIDSTYLNNGLLNLNSYNLQLIFS